MTPHGDDFNLFQIVVLLVEWLSGIKRKEVIFIVIIVKNYGGNV